MERPPLDLGHIGLVFLGGMIGTSLRAGLDLAIPLTFPLAILIANLGGAFLLGFFQERVASARVKLFAGTGILGSFTTYSALALGTTDLWADSPALAISSSIGTVILGLLAAAAGIICGRKQ